MNSNAKVSVVRPFVAGGFIIFVILTLHMCYVVESTLASKDNACPSDCNCTHSGSEWSLQCVRCPEQPPPNTTSVFLWKIEHDGDFPEYFFKHKSWLCVKNLSIEMEMGSRIYRVSNVSFLGLRDVKYLSLTGQFRMFEKGTFSHLLKLEEFRLLKHWFGSLSDLLLLFCDFSNIPLKTVDISQGENAGSQIVSGEDIRCFSNLPIINLNMSGLGSIIFEGITWKLGVPFPKTVEVVDLTSSLIVTTNNDGGKRYFQNFDIFMPNIRVLILNHVLFSSFLTEDGNDCEHLEYRNINCSQYSIKSPMSLDILMMNDMGFGISRSQSWCLEFDECAISPQNRLRQLYLASNNIGIVNIYSFAFQSLEVLDLSDNNINDITEMSFSHLTRLQILKLGSNNLRKMEENKLFGLILRNCTNLLNIDLSSNGLSTLPENMFEHNHKLSTINLANNQFQSLSFTVVHLQYLRNIDISYNRLKTINLHSLTHLKSVNLVGNPLKCNCDYVDKMREILKYSYALNKLWLLRCQGPWGDFKLNASNLGDIEKSCLHAQIVSRIIISLCIVSIAFVVCIIYKKRLKLWQIYLKFKYRKVRLQEAKFKFIAFVSYCHHGEEFLKGMFYPELEERLKQLLSTGEDCLCIDERHFQPGKVISEEILSAINASHYFICLISKNYVRSRWTEFETMAAWMEKRPVILVFLEHVPQKELKPILRHLFLKLVRLRWPVETHKQEAFWVQILNALRQKSSEV